MKKINSTLITFIFALGFMLVSAGAIMGLIYIVEGNAIELGDRVRAIAYNKAQQEERYETERLLEETKEEREALSNFVLTEGSVIDFITNIEAVASAQGLEFDTQAISPESTKDETFDELSMSFNFSGQKSAVEYMISVLETVPHHSYIRDISLKQSEDRLKWTVRLTLVVTILEND